MSSCAGQAPLRNSPSGQEPDKKWLFSENFPVDVRILAGGTAAFAGLLLYAYNRKVSFFQPTSSLSANT